jgi:aminoglycoside phosphotransferase family enzyme/predicted kinase
MKHRYMPEAHLASGLMTGALRDARPIDVPYAAVQETHSGVVFLIGDRAYKCKKPVNLGFLDFRTLQSRRACCEREVELNRRLAPDVYIGVAELQDPVTGIGEPLVLMHRMPGARRLSTLLQSGERLDDTVEQLARIMAAFHAGADRSADISSEGTRDAIEQRWTTSFEQVGPLAEDTLGGAQLTEIEDEVRKFLAGRERLFDHRVAAGRIVDGHGDLICDDIFSLDDGPRILDCLEFDDRLRYIDGLDDIAFLAMDLEKLGAAHLARLLLDRYSDFAGDPAPASLRHHYIAYRAFVRVKVNCLRHAQGERPAAADARAYADIAIRHLRVGAVRMILVGGLPGAGKSTVAGLVADRLGAVLLSTDRLRKEISGLAPLTRVRQPYARGLYDQKHSARMYSELLGRAALLLGMGESVVLDGSWNNARLRSQAAHTAKHVNAQLSQVECWAPPHMRQARLLARRAGVSDADPAVAARMALDADPWPPQARVINTGAPGDTLHQALSVIGAAHTTEPADV